MELIARSELVTLQGWLEALPQSEISTRPWLCVYYAWVTYYAGPREQTEIHLAKAELALQVSGELETGNGQSGMRYIAESEGRQIKGHVAALRAYLALQNGELDLVAQQAQRALKNLPDGDYAKATSAIALAETYRASGDLRGWYEAYREAKVIALSCDNRPMAVSAATYMADQLAKQGRLHEAHQGYLKAVRLAVDLDDKQIAAVGLPFVKLGDLMREWHKFPAAREYLSKGISSCLQWGHSDSLIIGYTAQSRAALATDDRCEAIEAFQRAERLVQRTAIDPWTVSLVDELRMRLWLADGDLPAAQRWAAEAGLDLKDNITFLRDIEHINLLHLLLAQGSQDQGQIYLNEALALADRLLVATEGVGWVSKSIPILILKALSFQALEKFDEAMAALRRAIRLARPGGYVSVFIDEGDQIEVLLETAGTNGRDGPYVQQLLAAIRTRKNARTTQPVSRQADAPIEPLSKRELQVLRLLASSMTVPEIAREMGVAVSTTRTHVRNIYGKLGVHGRIEALHKAQDLALI